MKAQREVRPDPTQAVGVGVSLTADQSRVLGAYAVEDSEQRASRTMLNREIGRATAQQISSGLVALGYLDEEWSVTATGRRELAKCAFCRRAECFVRIVGPSFDEVACPRHVHRLEALADGALPTGTVRSQTSSTARQIRGTQ